MKKRILSIIIWIINIVFIAPVIALCFSVSFIMTWWFFHNSGNPDCDMCVAGDYNWMFLTPVIGYFLGLAITIMASRRKEKRWTIKKLLTVSVIAAIKTFVLYMVILFALDYLSRL